MVELLSDQVISGLVGSSPSLIPSGSGAVVESTGHTESGSIQNRVTETR